MVQIARGSKPVVQLLPMCWFKSRGPRGTRSGAMTGVVGYFRSWFSFWMLCW